MSLTIEILRNSIVNLNLDDTIQLLESIDKTGEVDYNRIAFEFSEMGSFPDALLWEKFIKASVILGFIDEDEFDLN